LEFHVLIAESEDLPDSAFLLKNQWIPRPVCVDRYFREGLVAFNLHHPKEDEMRLGAQWHLKQAVGHLSAALGELAMLEGRKSDLGLDTEDTDTLDRARDDLRRIFDGMGEVVGKLP
jgi:hypothetical protein